MSIDLFLRKRFDSIKYDLKKVEEVVYDLSIRKLCQDGDKLMKAAPADPAAAPADPAAAPVDPAAVPGDPVKAPVEPGVDEVDPQPK